MYKYTIMISAAVVVLASLVNSVPANSAQTPADKYDPMSAAATGLHKNKQVRTETRSMFASEAYNDRSLLEYSTSGLFDAINVSKKFAGNLVHKVLGLLHTVDLKKLVKIVLVGGVVILLGGVTAASAAGIAAVVATVSAALPYFHFFFGGHKGEASDSEMDAISEFVLSAFNKYENQHRMA